MDIVDGRLMRVNDYLAAHTKRAMLLSQPDDVLPCLDVLFDVHFAADAGMYPGTVNGRAVDGIIRFDVWLDEQWLDWMERFGGPIWDGFIVVHVNDSDHDHPRNVIAVRRLRPTNPETGAIKARRWRFGSASADVTWHGDTPTVTYAEEHAAVRSQSESVDTGLRFG